MDVIQIGTGETPHDESGARKYIRELVLESLNHHAFLMYEISRQLNRY